MDDLIKSFNNQKIYKVNGKSYLVLSLTDHCVATPPTLVRQATDAICALVEWKNVDLVIGEEERGGFIAVNVALQNNLPFSLAKQNPVHLPNEIGIHFAMAYNKDMTLYLNGLKKGQRVVVVDDLIDTGGTMCALINAVRLYGAEITDVVALAEKIEMKGREYIFDKTGIVVKTFMKLDTSGSRSKVIETTF